ncbi:hypothetical protein [Streptomyces sp. Tu 3180]|uniref:golvesin C-terminal-like domain-containing protein n=1 Tax=Streptomyces sp. Tu 3180 TaxID=2682611 RepID=UPI001AA03A62|nr:hypothetical protein [Streptomyces sp. Tu 3180]
MGKSVVLVDDSDSQHTSSTGTWAKGDLAGQHGYDHRTHAAGTGTDAFTWTLDVPEDGTYTAYVKYPKATGAATTAKYTLSRGPTSEPAVTEDQNADTGTWVPLGSYSLEQGNDAGEWCRYEMSTSEFLYRVPADKEFKPFGVAEYGLDPTFQPGRSVHGS